MWKAFAVEILSGLSVPNCPECTAREKKKIQAKYEAETPEEERGRDDLYKLFDEIDIPMKMDEKIEDISFVRDGLYATREEISDIRFKLNQKERTRDDKHDDYLEWWQKSKKEKQETSDITCKKERRDPRLGLMRFRMQNSKNQRSLKRTGYILEFYEEDNKIDYNCMIQLKMADT